MQNISFGFRLKISPDCKDKSAVLCSLAKILANTCTNKRTAGNNLVAFSFPDTARFRRGQLGAHCAGRDRKLKYFLKNQIKENSENVWAALADRKLNYCSQLATKLWPLKSALTST